MSHGRVRGSRIRMNVRLLRCLAVHP
uniref:Uncharacterized protein n=1 Tax=Anguilla anguilla TaxID=7936 RepID=A0A0E9VC32_ANGAN